MNATSLRNCGGIFDGWWPVVSDIGDYGEAEHSGTLPVIDADHIRALLRLLGVVDLHDMLVYPDQVLIPDANFPWQGRRMRS